MKQWRKFDPQQEPLVIQRAALSLCPDDDDERMQALHDFAQEVSFKFPDEESRAYWCFRHSDGSVSVAVTWADE